MKIAVMIARILLGLAFLIFGLNAFLNFIPAPPLTGDVATFMDLFMRHGWFKFIGVLYVVAGLLLVVGRYVPIALVILGPILVNIVLFHLTINREGFEIALVFVALEIFLIWAHWPAFAGLFVAKMDMD